MKDNEKNIIEIYTDGACSGNPGPGGYGVILKHDQNEREISGCDPQTTNNRMEMMAVIVALRQIKKPCKIKIFTDSNYVLKGITEWIPGWISNNWVNSRKKPVLNRDLWQELLNLSRPHRIDWHWIEGHKGHPENERCDQLARNAIRNCPQSKKSQGPTKAL